MIDVNQITSTLRGLPDPELQKYAALHKGDPYILSLAVAESNQRKQMRASAQARMAGQQMPKVADQDIAQMAPQQLPEDQGIARLPTPNIQGMADGGIAGYGDDANEGMGMAMGGMFDFAQRSEPVVRMSGGGMLNFSTGGMKKLSGADLFEKALDMEGVTDPIERAFLKAVHGQESSGKTTEKTSNRNAHGAMQILPSTFKSVADPDMDINKPLDNMRAGIRYGKQGFAAANGDPVLAGAYYYGGPGGMQKAASGVAVSDPKNPKAPTTIDYGKSIAQRMTALLPIGSAVAGETPKPAAPTAAPAQPEKAGLESTGAGSNVLTGMVAGNVGINALQSAKDVLNAGFKPGTTAGQATRVLSTAAAVPQAVMVGGAAATKKAMTDLQAMSPDQRRALAANPMLSAMSGDAGLAGAIMDAAANNPEGPSKMPYSEQMTNVGKALLQHPDIERQRLAAEAKKPKPEDTKPAYDPNKMEPVRYDEFSPIYVGPEASNLNKKELDDAAAKAKAATPEEARKGLTNDDYLMMGLSLLASKSPNFGTAVGEAGVQALGAKREREKAESEAEFKKKQGKYYEAYGEAIERGAKEKNEQLEAEKLVRQYMGDWERNNKIAVLQDPTSRLQEENRIRQQIYASLGLTPIMAGQSAPAGAGDFKLVGVR
jgi:hypothetical protein